MKRTGIKVWVLTGDKVETAINIGVSAGLLDCTMAQFIVEDLIKIELQAKLDKILQKIASPKFAD